ncbi:MAG: Antitoxin Phd YefM, type toxin-antitoxin system [Candidatus Parcubacteria bacterium]
MQTITSREVQKNFGAVADLVSAGETVRVTRYGRPAFLILPETGDTEEILRRIAGRKLIAKLRNAKPNAAAEALTQEEVNKLIDECFT